MIRNTEKAIYVPKYWIVPLKTATEIISGINMNKEKPVLSFVILTYHLHPNDKQFRVLHG